MEYIQIWIEGSAQTLQHHDGKHNGGKITLQLHLRTQTTVSIRLPITSLPTVQYYLGCWCNRVKALGLKMATVKAVSLTWFLKKCSILPCVWWLVQKLWTTGRPLGSLKHKITVAYHMQWSFTNTYRPANNIRYQKHKRENKMAQNSFRTFPKDTVFCRAWSTSSAISFLNCGMSWHSWALAWCKSSSATRSPWRKHITRELYKTEPLYLNVTRM